MKVFLKNIIILILGMIFLCSVGCTDSETNINDKDTYFLEESIENSEAFYLELEAYERVLKGEEVYFDFYEGERSLDKISELFKDDISVEMDVIKKFAILDMDNDGIFEIVLELINGNLNMILHYKNGTVFSHTFGNRQVGNIKADGTFSWAGSAGYHGYGRLLLYKEACEILNIGFQNRDEKDCETLFYIGADKVTEKMYAEFSNIENKKEDVIWHDFTVENIEKEIKLK